MEFLKKIFFIEYVVSIRVGLLFILFFVILHLILHMLRVDKLDSKIDFAKKKKAYTAVSLAMYVMMKCAKIVSVIKIRFGSLISHNRQIRYMDLTLTICTNLHLDFIAFGYLSSMTILFILCSVCVPLCI